MSGVCVCEQDGPARRALLLSNPSLIVLHYHYQSAGRHTAPGLASFMPILAEIFIVFDHDNVFFFILLLGAIGVSGSIVTSHPHVYVNNLEQMSVFCTRMHLSLGSHLISAPL